MDITKNVVIIGTEEYYMLKKCKSVVAKLLDEAKVYSEAGAYVAFDVSENLIRYLFPEEYERSKKKAIERFKKSAEEINGGDDSVSK